MKKFRVWLVHSSEVRWQGTTIGDVLVTTLLVYHTVEHAWGWGDVETSHSQQAAEERLSNLSLLGSTDPSPADLSTSHYISPLTTPHGIQVPTRGPLRAT